MNSCKHANMRKVVYAVLDVPVETVSLSKTDIRNASVKLLGIEWTEITDRWCGDCGMTKYEIEQQRLHAANFKEAVEEWCIAADYAENKLARVAATRNLTELDLHASKNMVEAMYTNYGRGAMHPELTRMTIAQSIEHYASAPPQRLQDMNFNDAINESIALQGNSHTKIHRIKEVRALLNTSLMDAKHLVDNIYVNFGSGDLIPEYMHMTVEQMKTQMTDIIERGESR